MFSDSEEGCTVENRENGRERRSLGNAVGDVVGIREVIIIGYLGVMASQEALDEVGGFDVEAKASKLLSEYVMIDEIKNPRNVEHESCGFEASAPSIVDVLR